MYDKQVCTWYQNEAEQDEMTERLGLAKYPVGTLQGDSCTLLHVLCICEAICGLHLEM